MSDRSDRSDRLRKRFEGDDSGDDSTDEGDSANGVESDPSPDEEASASTDADRGTSLKELPSVLMYLPPDLREELEAKYTTLNAKHQREYGERLEKNRDFYPAVVEAGLDGKAVEDVLDLS